VSRAICKIALHDLATVTIRFRLGRKLCMHVTDFEIAQVDRSHATTVLTLLF